MTNFEDEHGYAYSKAQSTCTNYIYRQRKYSTMKAKYMDAREQFKKVVDWNKVHAVANQY
ncbi:hypothetical protein T10_4396 [Trichinella papuae]|uniref:Uncharacterized protein n=1 Tax=Trichinella papuae TaxID=268474 RepID=A0A0V1M5Q0_9BILA|nr:hypothetical protein T10_4396 [Trichinella papuae]